MTMNQDPLSPIPRQESCSHCSTKEHLLLHHVRHQGMLRRLCTRCVLLFHSQSFCPTCFIVYDRPPPPSNNFITCSKCYSCSHSYCVGSKSSNSYVCPLCLNPKTLLFNLKKVYVDCENKEENGRELDKKTSKMLFAAAKISMATMIKAAATLRVEAEKRAIEASVTRKRAREAIEHFVVLASKEKISRKDPSMNQKAANGVSAANDVSTRLNAVGIGEKERLQGIGQQLIAYSAAGNREGMKTNHAEMQKQP
ncbi:uncharacterized protein LOC124926591 [Impatiens glandulifera]|uniref:uncharacterized protein LOC124926591 n=1 Tax=Impatiens glandulifera TaxID=253017 RepID=UPI001FB11A67|nr:uncharacterized protein LOC124926591 [Impatiens glandulifera]